MPLTRYRIKNEYGLADPEMYRSADKDDPEALLEGVAMAGLVGLLRQLGDLAEFAAEIFHDLHEEVMATAARGHGLTVRIQQLEAEFPPIEKALLLQTNHSLYYANAGVEWHPNLQMEQNLIARGDLPRFVMDSYEESRGPPRLFLLDKFDVAGAGSCLKRYTDPSFLKVETGSDGLPTMEVQREKKVRKAKRKGSRWRNGATPETVPASHAKLHQLFLEERIENAYNDPARRVKLKKRPLHGSPFDSKSGKSYMEKFVETPSPESKTICEVPVAPLSLKWTRDDASESGLEVLEVSIVSPVKDMSPANGREVSSPDIREKQFMDDLEEFEPTISGEMDDVSSTSHAAVEEKELMVNGDGNREGSMDGYHSDEMTSEVENYMDALATESEMETDSDSRARHNISIVNVAKGGTDSDANEDMELQAETLGYQSVGKSASDDGNSTFGRSSSSLCIDRLSNMGDSTKFGGDRFSKVSPPESTVSDSGNLPDLQLLPPNKEAFGMESKELTVSTQTGTDDDSICDHTEPSQTSSSVEIESKRTPLKAGSGSCVVSEQDETSSDHIRQTTGISDYDETGENLDDYAVLASEDVPNQMEGDNMATFSTRRPPMDELEGEKVSVTMDTEHSSNNLELTVASESGNEVSNTEVASETCDGILLRVGSQSKLSLDEQHHFSSHAVENGSADHIVSSASLSRDSDDERAGTDDEVNDPTRASVVDLEKSTVSAEEQKIHVEDQNLLVEAVNEGNLSDLRLQHEGGNEGLSRALDGENIDSSIYNAEASGGESGDAIHPDIPYAGGDVCSNSGDPSVARVTLEETTALADDESQVLVKDQQPLDEKEKVTLHEENLPEVVDIQKEETSHEQVTQDRENTDSLTCNVEAVCAVAVTLVSSGSDDDSVLEDLVALEIRTEGVGNSQASVADIGVVPQERVDFSAAESHGWMKESGVEDKVNEIGVACADLDSAHAADLDSMSHGVDSTAVGVSGSLSEQTQSGFSYDKRTPLTGGELEYAAHPALLRIENALFSQSSLLAASAAASEESSKLLGDEPGVDSHLADDDSSKSSSVQAEEVPSLDLLDQETIFLPKPEGALEDDLAQDEAHSTEFQRVVGATQLPGCQNEEAHSPKSLNQEEQQGSSSVELLENFSIRRPSLIESLQGPGLDTGVHNFGPPSEDGEVNLSEMPPLPPLPPVQWRMGKAQNVPESKFPEFGFGMFPPLQHSVADATPQVGFPPFGLGTQVSYNPFLSPTGSETENPVGPHPYVLQMPPMNSDLVVQSNGMEEKSLPGSLRPETRVEPFEQYSLASETKLMQGSPSPQSMEEDTVKQHPGSSPRELPLPLDQSVPKTDTQVEDLQYSTENADWKDSFDQTNTLQEQHTQPNSEEGRVGSSDPWAYPANEGEKPNGTLIGNIPRPPKPLIEAVAAHDRTKLRKVAERVRPQLAPKLEERDSMLEQIRTKSFNLKPTTVTRPSIQQGPRTNLRVAAILEKANAIRQATAGSDEDDDTDSWSE